MWLLNIQTLELHEFVGDSVPDYAILSHRWGPEEVSFVEMKKPKHRDTVKHKNGYDKVSSFCARAQLDGYGWAWVDSCCIDKRSSAELSEAINSMFRWYRLAGCCYVYLGDVSNDDSGSIQGRLEKSVWWTRGWTLQELLAPRRMIFFAQDWFALGYKVNQRRYGVMEDTKVFDDDGRVNLADVISAITNIPVDFLTGRRGLGLACIAQRMSWASRRLTTREEDRAYSLMGLFDVNMPVIYGEGLEKAFTRLQREIMSKSPDQSILLWYRAEATSYRLLADSPDCFRNSGTVRSLGQGASSSSSTLKKWLGWSSSSMTNLGLRITLPIIKWFPEGALKFDPRDDAEAHLSLQRLDPDDSNLRPGDYAEAPLQYVCNDARGNPQRLSLNLRFLHRGLEGYPIFICHRPPHWMFSPAGDSDEDNPSHIFLCGSDYNQVGRNASDEPLDGLDNGTNESLRVLILHTIAFVLNVDAADVMAAPSLLRLGMDSIAGIRIIAILRKRTGVPVPLDLIMLNFSLTAIERCLLDMGAQSEPGKSSEVRGG
ncbi:HET-domain-containing protein [Rhypophila decipiens]|uniref:HET-domain-containing protein n=1 Tax=Rhypophila decipiens TaxID=261697 RepID=A0AAN7B6P6_9PEZI|nr:HET-domain-containing protein [Rhypophila decipiens]